MSSAPTARLRLLGIIFWLAGGMVITFGWMGMAELAYVDGQMPYLISGGAAGLGLILVGSTLVLSAAVLESGERTAKRAAELIQAAVEEAVEEDSSAKEEKDEEPEPEPAGAGKHSEA